MSRRSSEHGVELDIIERAVPDGTLRIHAPREPLLAELGLVSVSQAFEPAFAQLLRSLPDRDNGLLRSSAGLLFLKRHRPSRGQPQGMLEWDCTLRLAAAGIPVAEPVCAGLDHEGRSFLLTVGIDGEPLDDFLRRGRPPEPMVRELSDELAGLTARLHCAGLCHRDYYLCHVFVCPDLPHGERLVLIDLQRVAPTGRVRAGRWRLKDLAALGWSAVGLPVSDHERLRFLSLYVRGLAVAGVMDCTRRRTRRLARRINAKVKRLLARHGAPLAPAPRELLDEREPE